VLWVIPFPSWKEKVMTASRFHVESLEGRLVMSAPAGTPAFVPPPSSNPADYDLVLTTVCEDPIGIKILTNREKTKEFSDRSITTGTLKVQVVNLDTLDSLVLNVSGPQVAKPDGTAVTKGSWLFFFEAGNAQGQDPGLITIHGRTQYSADSFEVLQGRVVDICEALHTTSA
jgi:hypothetical protein